MFPPISIPLDHVPTFTNGKDIIAELETRIQNKRMINDVISGPDDVTEFFGRVFPEVTRQHNVGLTTTRDYKIWEDGENEITIEEDLEPIVENEKRWDVYVGGPAAIIGAVIQSRSGKEGGNVLYAHDGIRGISNWKGSAGTYILRDVCPLYHGANYNAVYVAFLTLRDALHRRVNFVGYLHKIKTDAMWVNVRIHYSSLLRDPGLLLLSLKNQWNALRDVGLYVRGTAFSPTHKTIAYTSIPHASLTPDILKKMNLPYSVLYMSNERSMSLDATPGKNKIKKNKFVDAKRRMEEIVGRKMIEERVLSKQETLARGYDPGYVFNLTERPGSGAFPMSIDEDMEQDIIRGGGEVRSQSRLVSVLVKPVRGGEDCQVTRVRWEDTVTGQMSTTVVNSLIISLGPSMATLRVKQADSKSWLGRLSKVFQPSNLMEKMMLATASTMIFLIKIDKTKVPDFQLSKFRDDYGYGNKRYLMLAEREVEISGTSYHVFAMQASGGGLFPYRHCHAETALNVINTVFSTSLQLDTPGIQYEIISVRTCSRGVTAQNFMRLSAPAANMAMVYGLGGLGMGTMVPNALLLKALITQRSLLAEGKISGDEFRDNLKRGQFDVIPHWESGNPFSRDYYKFFDMRSSRAAARQLFRFNISYSRNVQKQGIKAQLVLPFIKLLRFKR